MGRLTLERIDRSTYRVGDVTFVTDWSTGRPAADRLRVMKQPRLVEQYATFLDRHRSDRVIEVGVHEGGSTALLALLGGVEKLVAIELADEPPEALVDFVGAHGLGDVVRLHFGTDQADRSRLRAIVDEEFAGRPLDLVFDDASHLLGPTTACFESLFPALAPGGVYVLEDWSWQLRLGEGISDALESVEADPGDPAVHDLLADHDAPGTIAFERRIRETMEDPTPEERALFEAGLQAALRGTTEDELREASRRAVESGRLDRSPSDEPVLDLVVALLEVVGRSDGVIADIHVDPEWVSITRGPADIDPDTFRVDLGATENPASARG